MHIKNTTSSDAVTQTLKRNDYENGNKKTYTHWILREVFRHFKSLAFNIQFIKSHPELHM